MASLAGGPPTNFLFQNPLPLVALEVSSTGWGSSLGNELGPGDHSGARSS